MADGNMAGGPTGIMELIWSDNLQREGLCMVVEFLMDIIAWLSQ